METRRPARPLDHPIVAPSEIQKKRGITNWPSETKPSDVLLNPSLYPVFYHLSQRLLAVSAHSTPYLYSVRRRKYEARGTKRSMNSVLHTLYYAVQSGEGSRSSEILLRDPSKCGGRIVACPVFRTEHTLYMTITANYLYPSLSG